MLGFPFISHAANHLPKNLITKAKRELCIDKKIKGFPSWEINGKIILGVLTLEELSTLTGYEN